MDKTNTIYQTHNNKLGISLDNLEALGAILPKKIISKEIFIDAAKILYSQAHSKIEQIITYQL